MMKMFFKITRLHTRLNKNKNKIWINVKVFKIILKIMLKYVFQFSLSIEFCCSYSTIFEMMSLHCVPYILYGKQAEWKFYIQAYFQIIWINFTKMVAIIFFQANVYIWLTTPPTPYPVRICPLLPGPSSPPLLAQCADILYGWSLKAFHP